MKLGNKFEFQLNVGYNGKIWVNAKRPMDVIFIVNALERYVEMGETRENADFIMQTLPSK